MGPGTPTRADAVPLSLGLHVLTPGFLSFPRLWEELASTGRKGGWRHLPACRPGGGSLGSTSWEKRTGFKDTVCVQKSLVQGFTHAVGGRSPRWWEPLPAALPALPEPQAGSLPGDRGPGSRLLAHNPACLCFLGSGRGEWASGEKGRLLGPPGESGRRREAVSPAPCSGLLYGTGIPLTFSPISAKDLKSVLIAFPVLSLFGAEVTPALVGVRHVSVHEEGLAFGATKGKASRSSCGGVSPA